MTIRSQPKKREPLNPEISKTRPWDLYLVAATATEYPSLLVLQEEC